MNGRDTATFRRGVYRRRLAAAAAASLALHLVLARGLALTSLGLSGRLPAAAAASQPRPKPRAEFTIRTSRSPAAPPAHERPLALATPRPDADRVATARPAARAATERRPEEATDQAAAPAAAPARFRDRALDATATPDRAAPTPAATADMTAAVATAAAPTVTDAAPVPATVDRSRDSAAAAVASRWRPREVALLARLAEPALPRPAAIRDEADDGVPTATAAGRVAADAATAAATATADAAAAPVGEAEGMPTTAPAARPTDRSATSAALDAPRGGGARRARFATSPGGTATAGDTDGVPSAVAPDARGSAAIGGSGPRASATADGPDLGAPRQPVRRPLAIDTGGGDGAADTAALGAAGGGSVADDALPGAAAPRAVGHAADAAAGGAPLAAAVRRGSGGPLADSADDEDGLSVPSVASGTAGRPRRGIDEPDAGMPRPPERVAAVALPTEARVRDVAKAFARRGRDARPDRRADPRAARADAAVDRGLVFLARAQQADGRWSLGRFAGSGPADVPELASDTAATGLALLAFLGAGHDHFDGPHRDAVRRGLEFLISVQKPDGDLYVPADERSNSCTWLYSHGIASIALCEAVGMTGDPLVRPAAARACGFIAATRHPERGGWRYTPRSDADLSVSGWMLVALRSGALAGVETDPRALDGVRLLLDAAASAADPARYTYNPWKPDQRAGELSGLCMTAVGALMRLHTGAKPDDPRVAAAARLLAARRPAYDARGRDSYLWYYASQVLVHTGGPEWDAWYAALVDTLATAQETAGAKAGSWDPLGPRPDRWGRWGGRIYVTALHLLALEVPDRRLPTYTARE